ncbi:hypothetical protein ACIQ6V_26380 [Streptomyces sp. NPDC096198]|uniref:hypothetical protein n=1 Tax=Streptomyces sp. NPDC096198 TaxID=3366080 RepID=UPI00380F8FD5
MTLRSRRTDGALELCAFAPSATRPGLAEIHSLYGHPDGWGGASTSSGASPLSEATRAFDFGEGHVLAG